MQKKGFCTAIAILSLGVSQIISLPVQAEETAIPVISDQINPIIDKEGADPFVTTYQDQYLYTKTTGSNVTLGLADSIQTLGAAEYKCIYSPSNDLKDLWAPEIWHLDDTWYIYFAAVTPGEEMHFMYVLSNPSENPMEGEWTCEKLQGMDDKFAIDGTIMELNDKRYFLWSGWEGYENVRQDIYLAEMISPSEVKEEKILISKPDLAWEQNGNPLINEGPEVVVRGNTVNLVYSASGSWTNDYCLGLLTMDTSSDPKDPASWTKQETPILYKDYDVFGPGHNSFTVSKDGSEDLNIYHAARWQDAGWERSIRFGYVTFDENGKIQPMEVTSGNETLKIPSGEENIRCIPADAFTLSEKVQFEGEGENVYISGLKNATDFIELEIESEKEEDVTAVLLARSDKKRGGALSGIILEINGEKQADELYCSTNYAPLYFPIHLNQGENTLKIYTVAKVPKLEIAGLELRSAAFAALP